MTNRPADIIDVASEYADRMVEESLKAHAQKLSSGLNKSLTFCIDCDGPIPEARQLAVKGCQRCIDCQEIADHRTEVTYGKW